LGFRGDENVGLSHLGTTPVEDQRAIRQSLLLVTFFADTVSPPFLIGQDVSRIGMCRTAPADGDAVCLPVLETRIVVALTGYELVSVTLGLDEQAARSRRIETYVEFSWIRYLIQKNSLAGDLDDS